jgi:hypothetical protein
MSATKRNVWPRRLATENETKRRSLRGCGVQKKEQTAAEHEATSLRCREQKEDLCSNGGVPKKKQKEDFSLQRSLLA